MGDVVNGSAFHYQSEMADRWPTEIGGVFTYLVVASEQTPRNPDIKAHPFTRRRPRRIQSLVVISRRDRRRIVFVGQIAHVHPGLPVTLRRVVPQRRAEQRIRIGVVTIGVVHCNFRHQLCVHSGEETLRPVVAQFTLVVIDRKSVV